MQASSSSQRAQMFSFIDSWKGSGLSQQAYCREHGVTYHSFHYWYKVYREHQGGGAAGKPAFVPVQIQRPLSHTAVLELHLSDVGRLVFHQQPTVDFLKALL